MREMNSAELEALQTIVQWWSSKRPEGWRIEQHWSSPKVNTMGLWEERLASAAARVTLRDWEREQPRFKQQAVEGLRHDGGAIT